MVISRRISINLTAIIAFIWMPDGGRWEDKWGDGWLSREMGG
jgi:hypothetical protein